MIIGLALFIYRPALPLRTTAPRAFGRGTLERRRDCPPTRRDLAGECIARPPPSAPDLTPGCQPDLMGASTETPGDPLFRGADPCIVAAATHGGHPCSRSRAT